MQDDAPIKLGELPLHASGLVDDVVIQHQMEVSRSAVGAREIVEELHEGRRVFVLRDAVHDTPGACIEGTEDVALDVLAWRENERLLTAL